MTEKEWLEKAVNDKKMTNKAIAEVLGCSQATVSNRLKKYGITKVLPPKDRIYQIYVLEDKGVSYIAKEFSIGLKKAKELLELYNIPMKEKGYNQFSKITYEDVKKQFEEVGFELISKEYNNCYEHLEFLCDKGHHTKMPYVTFKRGARCKKCAAIKRGIKQRKSYKEVRKVFEKKGCKLLTLEQEYKDAHQKLEYICCCGARAKMSFTNFQSGYGCSECKRNKIKGANNHNYNPELTDYERLGLGRYEEGYKAFRRAVYKRDNFSCVLCGNDVSGNLVVHHLDGYSKNINKRTDIENGVTLCKGCHKDFHRVYGYGNNTREQFEEYKKKYK